MISHKNFYKRTTSSLCFALALGSMNVTQAHAANFNTSNTTTSFGNGIVIAQADTSGMPAPVATSAPTPIVPADAPVASVPTVPSVPSVPARAPIATTTTQAPVAPAAPAPAPTPTAQPATAPSAAIAAQDKDAAWMGEHEGAIQLARQGKYKPALAILGRLHKEHPEESAIGYDRIVVTSWAGHDHDVVAEYEKIKQHDLPAYVLEAVGHSYRNLHQPKAALTVYQRGLKASPASPTMKAGEIYSLADLKQFDQAVATTEKDLKSRGDRLPVLVAGGTAAYTWADTEGKKDQDAETKVFEALRYFERAQKIDAKNPDVVRGMTRTISLMGASGTAGEYAAKHKGILNAEEYRRLQGDQAAQLVRWGVVEPKNEASRYEETDAAIAQLDALIAKWNTEGTIAQGDVLRARFDRMVAYRNRERMQDVVAEYNDMRANNIEIPNYVMVAVADAYLYLRHPEKARDIALKILQDEPNNFEARRQLAYAYLECDQITEAYDTVRKLDDDQGIWVRLKGLPVPLPNSYRDTADLDQGSVRLYGNELGEAETRVSAVTFAAPNSTIHRHNLGNVYFARGLPTAALEQYEIGQQLNEEKKDIGNESGAAMANLDLQHFPTTEAAVADLKNRAPENLDVQLADRAWQIHNMAEFIMDGSYTARPSTSNAEGSNLGIEATIYSAPLDYYWRIFAGQVWSGESEPNSEGKVGLWASKVGAEYRRDKWVAEAAPIYAEFHDAGRFGGYAQAAYQLNDEWNLHAKGEIMGLDTPLRALNHGITSSGVNGGFLWRQNESRSVDFTSEVMRFSDSNLRTVENTVYQERWLESPHWTIDSITNLGSTQNTKDENRTYYNPKFDVIGEVGPRVTQRLYSRYETWYDHALTFTPGIYWQENHGGSFASSLRYEHRWHYDDAFEFDFGGTWVRQAFDNVYENDFGAFFNLVKRF